MDEKNRKAFKKMTKDQLIETIDQLNRDCEYWSKCYRETAKNIIQQAAITPEPKRPWYGWKYGSVSFDFWPPKDWLRLHYHGWQPGRYAQLLIGPIRIDWADS